MTKQTLISLTIVAVLIIGTGLFISSKIGALEVKVDSVNKKIEEFEKGHYNSESIDNELPKTEPPKIEPPKKEDPNKRVTPKKEDPNKRVTPKKEDPNKRVTPKN
jgi:hypothetical protein